MYTKIFNEKLPGQHICLEKVENWGIIWRAFAWQNKELHQKLWLILLFSLGILTLTIFLRKFNFLFSRPVLLKPYINYYLTPSRNSQAIVLCDL